MYPHDAKENGNLFTVSAGTVVVKNGTIDGFKTLGNGGGIYVGGSSRIELESVVIKNCSAISTRLGFDGFSGGVEIDGGEAELTNCTITNCFAESGGGAISSTEGNLTLTGCTISNCSTSGYYDGGIDNGCDAELINTKIIGCSSAEEGGGISSFYSNLKLLNCTITGCSSGENGGGVYFQSDFPTKLTLGGSTKISGNSSDKGRYVSDCFIHYTGQRGNLNPPAIDYYSGANAPSGMEIYISWYTDGTNLLSSTGGTSDYAKYFISTLPGRIIEPRGGEELYFSYGYNVWNDTGMKNGTVIASPQCVTEAELDPIITLTITPDEGYKYVPNSLTVKTDEDTPQTVTLTKVDDTTYTFVMPRDDVIVSAEFIIE